MASFQYSYGDKCSTDATMKSVMVSLSTAWKVIEKKFHSVGTVYYKNSWTKYNGHCYLIAKQSAYWSTAKKICTDMGSHLVSIESSAEQSWIKSHVSRGYPYWIGLSSGDLTFSWSHNNQKPSKTYFASGYPKLTGSRCVYFYNGKWYNHGCSSSRYFICEKDTYTCTSNPYSEIKTNNSKISSTDCSEIKKNGNTKSGVYKIYPDNSKGLEVYCDMTTDGGGWTVIQRHSGKSTNFQRNWSAYEKGFGKPSGDFWFGNKMMHYLTSKNKYELRIDLIDTNNKKKYALYKTFTVGNSASKYKLSVGGYSGDAGDMMKYHNGMKFTTYDQDNDLHGGNCATWGGYKFGPWWHNKCCTSALNSLYSQRLYWSGSTMMQSLMMIRKL